MALAASLVEIIHSFIAVHCGMLITDLISSSPITQVLSLSIFLFLGFYYLFKKNAPPHDTPKKRLGSNFTKGGILALINPQAIPFWVFVITYLQSSGYINLRFSNVIALLIGIALGKLLALMLFGVLSKAIVNKVQFLGLWINKIIGSVLLFLGLLLAVRYGFIGWSF